MGICQCYLDNCMFGQNIDLISSQVLIIYVITDFQFCYFFQDLQNVLDEATQGVVYVNFGSNVRSSELPIEKRDALINVFKRLNQTVLWKWEAENLDQKPENVVVRKWFPQQEILCKFMSLRQFISN